MKKSDAKPGAKVLATMDNNEWDGATGDIVEYVHDDDADYYTLVGVIRSKPASDGHVWVKWIEGDFDEEEQEVEISILTLASDIGEIEKEYAEVSKLIKANMKEAAKLISESHKLAKKAHVKSLESMYDAVSPLINAMDNAGWRSSSWGC
jgi:hypothetical protein